MTEHTIDSKSEADSKPPEEAEKSFITIDDVKKVEIRIGKILSAEKVEGSDKLLKLSVDFAEAEPRQVVSGIALHYPDPAVLIGALHPFVTNLEPRMIRGLESQAMIFAALSDGKLALMSPTIEMPQGTLLS